MSATLTRTAPPRWASRWLVAAGVYNLAWGTLTILFPHLLFDLVGAERLNYPEIWQCVGMIVGGVRYRLSDRCIGLENSLADRPGRAAGQDLRADWIRGCGAGGTFPPMFGLPFSPTICCGGFRLL